MVRHCRLTRSQDGDALCDEGTSRCKEAALLSPRPDEPANMAERSAPRTGRSARSGRPHVEPTGATIYERRPAERRGHRLRPDGGAGRQCYEAAKIGTPRRWYQSIGCTAGAGHFWAKIDADSGQRRSEVVCTLRLRLDGKERYEVEGVLNRDGGRLSTSPSRLGHTIYYRGLCGSPICRDGANDGFPRGDRWTVAALNPRRRDYLKQWFSFFD